jgi:hypothetical protein
MAKRAFGGGYRRLEWFCNKEDSELVSTAKEIGFKYEGVFRNYGVVKGTTKIGQTGKNKDVLFAILTSSKNNSSSPEGSHRQSKA